MANYAGKSSRSTRPHIIIVRVFSSGNVSTADDVAGILTIAKRTAENLQNRPSNILTCTVSPEAGQYAYLMFTEKYILYIAMSTKEHLCPSDFAEKNQRSPYACML